MLGSRQSARTFQLTAISDFWLHIDGSEPVRVSKTNFRKLIRKNPVNLIDWAQ
ncbi:hypothetical protein BH10PLA2_BH10PLA2_26370 [soil metagenome]